jgi:hypothetical protein
MLGLNMSLDFSSWAGSFFAVTTRCPRSFLWCILHDSSGALEQVEVIYKADLDDAIRELKLQEFGDEETQKALRTLLLRYRDLFSHDVDCAWFSVQIGRCGGGGLKQAESASVSKVLSGIEAGGRARSGVN